MSTEFPTVRARFALRFRCANCRMVMCRELTSPNLADAPADVEELLESNLLNKQYYPCDECDNPVSTLIGVKLLEPGEVFDPEGDAGPQKAAAAPLGRQRSAGLPTTRRRGLGEGIGRPPY